jgi:hypothetical protein
MRHRPFGAGGPRLLDSAPNLRVTNRLMLQGELGPGSTQWLQSTESVLTALRDSKNQQIRHFSAARSAYVAGWFRNFRIFAYCVLIQISFRNNTYAPER